MRINLEIDLNDSGKVSALIAFLSTFNKEEEKAPKPKRKTSTAKPKAETAKEKEDESADSLYTLEDVRTELAKYVKKHREATRAEFKRRGIKNISALEEKDYEDFMTFLASLEK